MKTPDSRPRFQSSNRHYHRFREVKDDDWTSWIDGAGKNSGKAVKIRNWLVAGLMVSGVVGAICYSVF